MTGFTVQDIRVQVVMSATLVNTQTHRQKHTDRQLLTGYAIINQSINQYIYNAPWYRGACYSADYAEAKRNVLSRVLLAQPSEL